LGSIKIVSRLPGCHFTRSYRYYPPIASTIAFFFFIGGCHSGCSSTVNIRFSQCQGKRVKDHSCPKQGLPPPDFTPQISHVVHSQIDLPAAEPERVTSQVQSTFGFKDPLETLYVSAKTGKGVEDLLEAIIRRVPPPRGRVDAPLRAFLFDSL